MMNIVEEFLKATPAWAAAFKDSFIKNKPCFLCGIIPENMEKLAKEVEIIKEKAWKYDNLNK